MKYIIIILLFEKSLFIIQCVSILEHPIQLIFRTYVVGNKVT